MSGQLVRDIDKLLAALDAENRFSVSAHERGAVIDANGLTGCTYLVHTLDQTVEVIAAVHVLGRYAYGVEW